MNKVILYILIAAAILAGGFFWLNMYIYNEKQEPNPPSADVPSQAKLSGVYLCLPHRNTDGPQTMECALGLKTDAGVYYALDMGNLLNTGTNIKFPTGSRIEVEGMLVPIEQISSDQWQKYPIEGIIKVDNVTQVQISQEPKSMEEVAREYVQAHSVSGMQFDLILQERMGNWVTFSVIPKNVETDNAQLFMELVNGTWEVRGFGTAFPDLYEEHPDLFE